MKNKLSGWLAATIIMVSCANPVYVEQSESANLAKYKTFSWVDVRAKENDTKNVTGLADEVVRKVAKEELARRGWMETDTDPDALISYDVLVERSTQQQLEPVYTHSFSRVYYNPYRRRWATVFYPSRFIGYDNYAVPVTEGTLTITITDAETDKVVWQGWTTETMENRKLKSNDVQRSVRNILKKLETGT